jgi:hypothetical protein
MINWADRLIDKKVDKITIEPVHIQHNSLLIKTLQYVILSLILSAIFVLIYTAFLLADILIHAF